MNNLKKPTATKLFGAPRGSGDGSPRGGKNSPGRAELFLISIFFKNA